MDISNWQIIAGGVVFVILLYYVLSRRTFADNVASVTSRPVLLKRNKPIKPHTQKTSLRYLVVGGSGFLGSHIVEALIERGEKNIRIFDRVINPIFEGAKEVSTVQGNLLEAGEVKKACENIDVVFHTAASVDYWSRLAFQLEPIYNVNVRGTQNVIDACIATGVKKLIHTSTALVLLRSGENIDNYNETVPYSDRPVGHYTTTKCAQEKVVLSANGKNGFLTGAIRPNALWGPRDNIMAEAVYRAGKPGEMLSMGNLQDWVYVENMVHSQLCLEAALRSGSVACGKAYCISNEEPMAYDDFWRNLNRCFGGKDSDIKYLPPYITYPLAYISELLTWLSGGNHKGDFWKLTPAVLGIARRKITLDCSLAKKEIGYKVLLTMNESFEKVRKFYMSQ